MGAVPYIPLLTELMALDNHGSVLVPEVNINCLDAESLSELAQLRQILY